LGADGAVLGRDYDGKKSYQVCAVPLPVGACITMMTASGGVLLLLDSIGGVYFCGEFTDRQGNSDDKLSPTPLVGGPPFDRDSNTPYKIFNGAFSIFVGESRIPWWDYQPRWKALYLW
jgi:hypothetical protein